MTQTALKKTATGRSQHAGAQPTLAAEGEGRWRPHGLAPGELVKLHHTLAELLNTGNGVVCQFIAPETNAGTEDVVYDLAYISAAWLGKREQDTN